MKKSIQSALIASVALIAANVAIIDTASAGKSHVRVRNTILGIGLLGAITHSNRHDRHYSTYSDEYVPDHVERVEVYTEYPETEEIDDL